MQKRALVVFVLLVLLSIPSVLAAWPLSVEPERIPPEGTVTINFENTHDTDDMTIVRINVTGPDGTRYTKTYAGVVLSPGDKFSDTFGHGDTSWSPDADTSKEGKYIVNVYGPESPVGAYFDVSDMFSVPEITLPGTLAIAIGFILLLNMSTRAVNKRKSIL